MRWFVKLLIAVSWIMLIVGVMLLMAWPASHFYRIQLAYQQLQPFPTVNPPTAPSAVPDRKIGVLCLNGTLYLYWLEQPPGMMLTPPNARSNGLRFYASRMNNHVWSLPEWFPAGNTYTYQWTPHLTIWRWALGFTLLPGVFLIATKTIRRLFFTTRLQTNLCLHCGYNLTGVERDACPECGAARPLVTVSSRG